MPNPHSEINKAPGVPAPRATENKTNRQEGEVSMFSVSDKQGINRESFAELPDMPEWDLLEGTPFEDMGQVDWQVGRAVELMAKELNLHPLVAVPAISRALRQYEKEYSCAKYDECQPEQINDFLENVWGTVTTKEGDFAVSLLDLAGDDADDFVLTLTSAANIRLRGTGKVPHRELLEMALFMLEDQLSNSVSTQTVYATVDVFPGSHGGNTVDVCLISDELGARVSIENFGVELTADQAISLAEALTVAAGELKAQEAAL